MGAGGSSGAVDFPSYIKSAHENMLHGNPGAPDTLTVSAVDVMNVMLGVGGNPYSAVTITAPTARIATGDGALLAQEATIAALSPAMQVATALADSAAAIDLHLPRFADLVDGEGLLSHAEVRRRIAEVQSSAMSTIDEVGDWTDAATEIVDFLENRGLLSDTLDLTIFDGITADVGAAMTAALLAASQALSAESLAVLVDAYQEAIDDSRARAYSVLANAAVQNNSSHSSAFIIAGALVERGAIAEKAKIAGQVYLDVLKTALGIYDSLYRTTMTSRLQAQANGRGNKDQLISASLQFVLGSQSNRVNSEQAMQNLYLGAYKDQLETRIRTKLMQEQEHSQLVSSAAQLIQQSNLWKYDQLDKQATRRLEWARVAHTLVAEHEAASLDRDVKHAMWDIETFHAGASILSAPSGMSALVPKGPSRAQTALGGALQGAGAGASIGAAIGAAGGPIGAAGGAVIGAGAGLLMGLFG